MVEFDTVQCVKVYTCDRLWLMNISYTPVLFTKESTAFEKHCHLQLPNCHLPTCVFALMKLHSISDHRCNQMKHIIRPNSPGNVCELLL